MHPTNRRQGNQQQARHANSNSQLPQFQLILQAATQQLQGINPTDQTFINRIIGINNAIFRTQVDQQRLGGSGQTQSAIATANAATMQALANQISLGRHQHYH